MSQNAKLTAFISSTCYDLKAIRQALSNLVKNELGYEVMLSDDSNFPVDPSLSTLENCLHNIDRFVDIFILVVGNKYGYITETGHSITNLEYMRAKARGIPIYIFIDNSIISVIPIWKKSPTADFSGTVDSPKLLNFVDELRNTTENWVFGFENADDIIVTLKAQLCCLFKDCLGLRLKANIASVSLKVRQLTGKAFEIAILKPDAWELKLFAQLLSDGLYNLRDRRLDLQYRFSFEAVKIFKDFEQISDFCNLKNEQMVKTIDMLEVLVETVLAKALNEDVVTHSDNPDYIIYSAEKVVQIYSTIITWALDMCSIACTEEYQELVTAFMQFCESPLRAIELLSHTLAERASQIPDDIGNPEIVPDIDITIVLESPDIQPFMLALDKIKKKHNMEP